MKFVLAPDSFKGGMTAKEAANAMQTGLEKIFPAAEFEKVPMADGGEGTVQSLVDATNGRLIDNQVTGPLGTPVQAKYGILGNGQTAVIEMASASGIQFVNEQTHNPLITTTYGTGELILDAMSQGIKQIIIGIGGSATNDGGAGMAQALGAKLLDQNNHELPFGGGQLGQLDHIDVSGLNPAVMATKIIVASDVTNPLVGPDGASAVFGPQKGATPEMVKILDANLQHYADIINRDLHHDLANLPGAGAAGGLGAGLLAFTNSEMQRGIDIVIEYSHLKERAQNADFVFTGEGGIDFQTKFGKTPYGVAQATKSVSPNAPVIVLAGNVGAGIDSLYAKNAIDTIFPIVPGVTTLDQAIADGPKNLALLAENVGRLIGSIHHD
ncbi:glycerate kinase [Lactobacillus sp. LC28-10]|uniref:Glycerate kinase n=1 Tax=Secundilactobacillus angelensis TaxID=2722706 RepID=A0ABX1L089_9LACO|nr:glycerate kinase [Secundilactobacillus angelensis]MCH5461998.1 glycerate kinase [Secundilactobacillus angelensis]NLR18920.1 glycerate kinase [Secundilactobacillus angelensis]